MGSRPSTFITASAQASRDSLARWKKRSERQKAIVTAALADNKGYLSNQQINGLAKALHRSKEVIRDLVDQAREDLAASAVDYVKMHKQATQDALANGDAKSLEVAVKASQWAMNNISHDGKRIVDKPTSGPVGTKIMLGIKLGGLSESEVPKALVAKVETLDAGTVEPGQ